MKKPGRCLTKLLLSCTTVFGLLIPSLNSQSTSFHGAPASAKQVKNPSEGRSTGPGGQGFRTYCSRCHGDNGEGSGNVPSLNNAKIKATTPGDLFWFITHGDIHNGMPPWAKLPQRQRWQIVSYVQALGSPGAAQTIAKSAAQPAVALHAPPPKPPFTDFRYEKPGTTRKISLNDLPAPFATPSSSNGPKLVARPEGAWPKVPNGFKVEQYAVGLDDPRQIRTAPNGDFFVAENSSGEVRVFRGFTKTGKPELVSVFATGLNRPFGINFYPPGEPRWVYVTTVHEVVRYPYENGDVKARAAAEHIADLPGGDYHWTRDIQFSPDGGKMFVAVGAASNVDDPDTTPAEKNTADILQFNPDGSDMRVYASGIRNPVGLAINPATNELWCSTNERDGLGDNLVPDYVTHVADGGFYGWPWWYMGGQQDPRHAGKHPELRDKVITPDVLLHRHNASLGVGFTMASSFPTSIRAISSPPNMGHGIGLFGWATN